MKKRIISLVLTFMMCMLLCVNAFAETWPRIVDSADILTNQEEAEIVSVLDSISQQYQMDVTIITIPTLQGADVVEAADYYYEYCDYGFGAGHDGMLLLISMEERDWYISTEGRAINAIDDFALDYIKNAMVPSLSSGNYRDGFLAYAKSSGEMFDRLNNPDLYKPAFPLMTRLVTGLVIGFIIALIVTSVMKGKLKSVYAEHKADNYIRNNSMHVTRSRELFLYSHVNRVAKSSDNNGSRGGTHTSSSGRTHGGGGGKF